MTEAAIYFHLFSLKVTFT